MNRKAYLLPSSVSVVAVPQGMSRATAGAQKQRNKQFNVEI